PTSGPVILAAAGAARRVRPAKLMRSTARRPDRVRDRRAQWERISVPWRGGPLARALRDAAGLSGLMARPDPADPASDAVGERFESDYARFLDPEGLRGARLGVARRFFAESAPLDGFLDECVAILKRAGAIVVDPADLPMH